MRRLKGGIAPIVATEKKLAEEDAKALQHGVDAAAVGEKGAQGCGRCHRGV
jgi:hypothetical protein